MTRAKEIADLKRNIALYEDKILPSYKGKGRLTRETQQRIDDKKARLVALEGEL